MGKFKHGHSPYREKTPTYSSWASMKTRCDNSNDRRFHDYGGRGISYDKEWSDFNKFIEDMGERPHGTTLDRINTDSGYSKQNCRWATPKEQARNRRIFSTNSSGFNGVERNRGSWRAVAHIDGKRKTILSSKSFEECVKARMDFDAARGAGDSRIGDGDGRG